MPAILEGMRIVEGSAFVAAPLGGMALAQLGADVIRFDPIGGGLDIGRWPLTDDGKSLFWAGLNKGKRSIAIDLGSGEGQEIATALITAPGPDAGMFLTNFPARGWLDYDRLTARRADLIMVNVIGNPDGSNAVDYTVNCAAGFPFVTGPESSEGPVNNVLPAWDCITGMTAAVGILAAERHRRSTGEGRLVRLPLSDVAMAMAGNLGYIGEVCINSEERGRYGNYLYGAFGRDFATGDGKRIMLIALTRRQWRGLIQATGLGRAFAEIGRRQGLDLDDEGNRFKAREAIAQALEPWFGTRGFDDIAKAFDAAGVCWGPYQTFKEMVENDPRASTANPMFQEIEQPGIGAYPAPASPLDFTGLKRGEVAPAPELGQHTDEILDAILGLSGTEIARLHDNGVVAGPI
ncbi:MAG: CoA transferase [Proteobacteria bacterium]|nr:CoA transferase [Pseudomonadota bacterium]